MPENIEHIDMKFAKALDDICPNCRYDVKFNRENNRSLPLFEEFKSYNSETWSKIANDKGFIQQFESYLQKVNKIEVILSLQVIDFHFFYLSPPKLKKTVKIRSKAYFFISKL